MVFAPSARTRFTAARCDAPTVAIAPAFLAFLRDSRLYSCGPACPFGRTNMIRLLTIATRYLAVWLVISVLVMLPVPRPAAHAADAVASPQALTSLIIGPDDLAWDAILWTLRRGSAVTRYKFQALNSQQAIEEVWAGPPSGTRGRLMGPGYGIHITSAVTDSPEEAAQVALKQIQSYAVSIPEVTGDPSVASFADRAWGASSLVTAPCRASEIVFVRGNVVADIEMSRKDGFDPQLLFSLGRRPGRKIDATLAGYPEPVPVLPLAADQELRVGLADAWELRDLGRRLWRDKATTIALYDTNGLPRSLPAQRIGGDDYILPLRYLAAILGRQRVNASPGKGVASVTLMGKALVFRKGERRVKVDGRAALLSRPAEFVEGAVLVPLSLVEQLLGQRVVWSQVEGMMRGRLRPS
jgi:hypothetical protein